GDDLAEAGCREPFAARAVGQPKAPEAPTVLAVSCRPSGPCRSTLITSAAMPCETPKTWIEIRPP
ncbi:MAG: hypothetical protein J0I65_21205, partial [Variovorax sp.]|nr:hypothetical protein [Variovorax sp.]